MFIFVTKSLAHSRTQKTVGTSIAGSVCSGSFLSLNAKSTTKPADQKRAAAAMRAPVAAIAKAPATSGAAPVVPQVRTPICCLAS